MSASRTNELTVLDGDRLLSPREVADALGLSESTLKRWADAGELPMARTAGGHRRVDAAEVLRFARARGLPIVRPQLLGLGRAHGDEPLIEAIIGGELARARAMVVARLATGEEVASLCDGPLRAALERVGATWDHSADGVLIEHRATAICVELLAAIRAAAPAPGPRIAIGGGPPDDPYLVPSLMCAAALAHAGYRTTNLGPDTPLEAWRRAAADRPTLLWLSMMAQPTSRTLLGIDELARDVAARGGTLIVGGRWASDVRGPARVVTSIAELVAAATPLAAPSRRDRR